MSIGRRTHDRVIRVVVATDRVLMPADRGNRQRIVELIAALRGAGVRVALVTLRSCVRTGLDEIVDEVIAVDGQPFPGGDPTIYRSPELIAAVTAASSGNCAAVIAEYLYLTHCLENVPAQCLKVVDPHDVIHKRAGFDFEWIRCSRAQEIGLLRQCEALLATQHSEKNEFSEMLPHCNVIMFPHSTSAIPTYPRSKRKTGSVMMLGSSHPGNGGLIEFAERVWPSVATAAPRARLHVYGQIAQRFTGSVPGIALHGYCPDLEAAFAEAELFLAPLTKGTGLKIKIVESLARGKAIVTTAIGADGLAGGYESALVVARDLDQLGRKTVELLSDHARRFELESRAAQFAAANYSREAALREFLLVLADIAR